MQITDFTIAQIERAARIGSSSKKERGHVPALPPIDNLPDLSPYAKNGLGVAAYEGDTMLGYLCCVPPFENAFGSTFATGVFSPMGANGAIGENRAKVYARLYQAAAEKWVRAGASSHAICLYAHDREVQEQFFRYGFGIRCMDAIRCMDDITAHNCEGYSFTELDSTTVLDVLPLENKLNDGYLDSPFFMYRDWQSAAEFLEEYEYFRSIYLVAKYEEQIVAFVRAEPDGETFIRTRRDTCMSRGVLPAGTPWKRHQPEAAELARSKLKAMGYTRLGVSFESLNPAGYGFWLKYFDPYTHSVVRRIDEKAVMAYVRK